MPSSAVESKTDSASAEIREESLKSSLQEIISDMDRVIEREEQLTLRQGTATTTSETLTTTATAMTASSQQLQHRASIVDANNNSVAVEFPHQVSGLATAAA